MGEMRLGGSVGVGRRESMCGCVVSNLGTVHGRQPRTIKRIIEHLFLAWLACNLKSHIPAGPCPSSAPGAVWRRKRRMRPSLGEMAVM
jgi:hypothetical protein